MRSTPNKSLSVVIPTYNEKENIASIVPKVLEVFDRHYIDGEIIIVNDQGSDGSEEILKELARYQKRVKVIFRTNARSLSSALIEGFSRASKDHIVCIDADLCHDPQYFPVMLKTMDSYDLCIGSRYLNDKFYRMPSKSSAATLLSICSQFLTRTLLGLKESDFSNSYRLFKKEVFTQIRNDLKEEGNVFFVEFLFEAKRKGFQITEIQTTYGQRIYGKTKLHIFKEGSRYLFFVLKTFLRRGLSHFASVPKAAGR